MRTQTICISERNLMYCIGGQLFDQAPNRQPRKAEIIMQKVKEAFRKDAYNDNECYALEIPKDKSYEWLKTLLMGLPEFVELNLTQVEFEKNISVDDENRPKFCFTTRYDKYDSESWKRDFIDLDAFIRNAHRMLMTLPEIQQDCFCCKHGKSELCKTCLVNPDIKYHFECCRAPKGKYTFACKFNCPEHYYICCEECDKKESCSHKCDGNSDSCGNKVME